MQFEDFANIEASEKNSYLASQTSAITCYEPEWSNLGLVNLGQRDDFASYSGLGTDAIYCTDFSGIYEQCCETETEERNFGSTSNQEVNKEQRVEEESADVVNASPKLALLSESSCLHARDELYSWISAPAIPLAQPQPQFFSKQNSRELSLSLQLPTCGEHSALQSSA